MNRLKQLFMDGIAQGLGLGVAFGVILWMLGLCK